MKVESCGSSGPKVIVVPEPIGCCTFVEIDSWDQDKYPKDCETMYILADKSGSYFWNGSEWIFLSFGGTNIVLYETIGENTDGAMTQKASREMIYDSPELDSISIGLNASAGITGNVAIGQNADTQGSQAIAIGLNAKTKATESIAIGKNSAANNLGAIAIGGGAIASGVNNIAFGDDSVSTPTRERVVSVGGSPTNTRAIENVTDPELPQDAATKKYVDDAIPKITQIRTTIGVNGREDSSIFNPDVISSADLLWTKQELPEGNLVSVNGRFTVKEAQPDSYKNIFWTDPAGFELVADFLQFVPLMHWTPVTDASLNPNVDINGVKAWTNFASLSADVFMIDKTLRAK